MSETETVSAVNKTGWKAAAAHPVTLPSGVTVEMKVPNLPNLIKTGQIPNALVEEALGAISAPEKITAEKIVQQADFYAKLVSLSVVKPSVTEEEVAELPFEDVEMIVQIATRERDLDAIGHHIGGLHRVDDFRKFRGLDSRDSVLEDF